VSIRGDRLVWGPAREVDLFGTVSPDGRYLTYVDWVATGNVVVRDLLAGSDRTLTTNTQNAEHGYGGLVSDLAIWRSDRLPVAAAGRRWR
jgi:hypothetical protein